MNNNARFARIPQAELPRSSFDRSFTHKLTFDAGKLIPVFLDEVLPGDTFNIKTNMFVRLTSPLATPIMDDLYLDIQYFYVPCRILWDNWKRFQGEQRNPGDSTDYTIPQIDYSWNTTTDPYIPGEIYDCFGIPPPAKLLTGEQKFFSVNALPFRAYNLIWNEWYRDQNLQQRAPEYYDDAVVAENNLANYKLLPRGKRHDYFTSCLPWPQKGPGVEIPLGDTINASGDFLMSKFYTTGGPSGDFTNTAVGINPGPRFALNLGPNTNDQYNARLLWNGVGTLPPATGQMVRMDTQAGGTFSSVNLDVSGLTAITINSLRQAVQLQRLLERDARGGTRYTEILRAHFGVIAPDASLQRPEYLGGTSRPISVNTVEQTSSTDGTSPQANLAAYAVTGASEDGFTHSFTEHGYILGLASVRANLTYQQGLHRMWTRKTRYDFYMPVLAHLGEQAVLNKEIYFTGDPTLDDAGFGYQERHAEYRYFASRISGLFRSTAPQPLDVWHLSQKFENAPALNDEFIRENPPIPRVTAVNTDPNSQFLGDFYFNLHCARVMPTYSVPGMMDHF